MILFDTLLLYLKFKPQYIETGIRLNCIDLHIDLSDL